MTAALLPDFLREIARCPACGASRARQMDDTPVCPSCGQATSVLLEPGPLPIWDALGSHRPPRTLAQLSNVVWPTPQIYERLWRVRSLSLLSGRSFPVAEELRELTSAVAAARPSGPGVVVDIGCSEGLYARHLAADGWNVVAVDHSRPFLRAAARRIASTPAADRVALVRATAQALPLIGGCVDVVAIGGSLNEIGDAQSALREAARVLRPGGVLFSMHLVDAATRRGRLLQRALRVTGIRPYSRSATTALLDGWFRVETFTVDGVVARLVAVRTAEVA